MPLWREIIDTKLARVHAPASDKRCSLAEAIEAHVRPGMTLNPVSLQARPVAALHELIRQFSGRPSGFDFVSSSLSGNYLQLVGAGTIARAIVSFAGEGYPTPGPSPVVGRALAGGYFALENWSMLTVSQRLLAGAMGVPFTTTRSLVGSDMARELEAQGLYSEVADPFAPDGQAAPQALIPACVPDIAFVHAWAADPAGNAICFPPHQENVYGALAARHGVVLTVHRVVTPEFVREHAHLVRIPAERVVAVCEVPYGSHPYGNYAVGIPEFRAYANDYDFMREHRRAQNSGESYDAWLDEWIRDVPDHDAYLAKLGLERLEALEHLAQPHTWRDELEHHAASLDACETEPANAIEEMIVQAARLIVERVRSAEHDTVLSGVGQAALAAWLAYQSARDAAAGEGPVEFTLAAETGMIGHDPRPADPFLVNYRNMPTTTQLTDVIEALGILACGGSNRCLATLGAGQIDRFGNVNSSWNADGSFIVGSGGANDLASAANEVLIVAHQRESIFVEKVDFVTSPGRRVRHVVSSLGRYEMRGEQGLVLTAAFQSAGASVEAVVEKIRARCGFPLTVAEDIAWLPPAEPEELATLRVYDPERAFLGKSQRSNGTARA